MGINVYYNVIFMMMQTPWRVAQMNIIRVLSFWCVCVRARGRAWACHSYIQCVTLVIIFFRSLGRAWVRVRSPPPSFAPLSSLCHYNDDDDADYYDYYYIATQWSVLCIRQRSWRAVIARYQSKTLERQKSCHMPFVFQTQTHTHT